MESFGIKEYVIHWKQIFDLLIKDREWGRKITDIESAEDIKNLFALAKSLTKE